MAIQSDTNAIMSNEIQNILTTLAHGRNLSRDETARAFQIIMNAGATPAQMGAFLMGLRQKGETPLEIAIGAETIRQKALPFSAPPDCMDTCGTGGDGQGTVNVSTAVAIILAACGVPVAKHGGKAVTSASGSADVLEALGVNVNAEPMVMEQAIRNCNLAFLFAPKYHTAMRHIAPVRRELGLRSIMNLIGPLTNPAKPTRQMVGVYAPEWLEPMAEALNILGCAHAWVVHGEDGGDEISITGPSHIAALKNGVITRMTITPSDAGLPIHDISALHGGLAEDNARALSVLLAGQPGAYRDIVLLNTAACLMIAEKTNTLSTGAAMAGEAIDSGRAREVLATLATISKGNAA